MSAQEFVRNKSSIGKLLFVGAIGTWGVHLMLYIFDVLLRIGDFRYMGTFIYIALIISHLLLACGAACFYLMKAQPQVAARVWGILGALTFTFLPGTLMHPVGIITTLMAMGGALLAVEKPRLAGILMLLSALLCWSWGGMLIGIARMNFITWPVWSILLPFGVTSFLIPAGILALSRQREEPVSRKMALGLIGVFFIAPLLGYLCIYHDMISGLLRFFERFFF